MRVFVNEGFLERSGSLAEELIQVAVRSWVPVVGRLGDIRMRKLVSILLHSYVPNTDRCSSFGFVSLGLLPSNLSRKRSVVLFSNFGLDD